jgi:hypothetical protein
MPAQDKSISPPGELPCQYVTFKTLHIGWPVIWVCLGLRVVHPRAQTRWSQASCKVLVSQWKLVNINISRLYPSIQMLVLTHQPAGHTLLPVRPPMAKWPQYLSHCSSRHEANKLEFTHSNRKIWWLYGNTDNSISLRIWSPHRNHPHLKNHPNPIMPNVSLGLYWKPDIKTVQGCSTNIKHNYQYKNTIQTGHGGLYL